MVDGEPGTLRTCSGAAHIRATNSTPRGDLRPPGRAVYRSSGGGRFIEIETKVRRTFWRTAPSESIPVPEAGRVGEAETGSATLAEQVQHALQRFVQAFRASSLERSRTVPEAGAPPVVHPPRAVHAPGGIPASTRIGVRPAATDRDHDRLHWRVADSRTGTLIAGSCAR